MKKIQFIIALSFMAMLASCGNNFQMSSTEEAKYVVTNLSDFQEFIQYFSVEATSVPPFLPAKKPRVLISDPVLGEKEIVFIHEIIYKTTSGGLKLLLLNDARPPKVVATKEIK